MSISTGSDGSQKVEAVNMVSEGEAESAAECLFSSFVEDVDDIGEHIISVNINSV